MKPSVVYKACRFGIGTCLRRPGEFRYLLPYLASMVVLARTDDAIVLGSQLPWVSYRMIAFLKRVVDERKVVFEYGSGGSTFFFAKRARTIISVEHDAGYFDYVQRKLKKMKVTNCTQIFLPPEHDSGDGEYVSGNPAYTGQSFERYVKAVQAYPDRHFDIVFVDGRARSRCLRESANKVREDGYLILDNASRGRYRSAAEALVADGWSRLDIGGLTPYSLGWDVTSVFKRGNRSLERKASQGC